MALMIAPVFDEPYWPSIRSPLFFLPDESLSVARRGASSSRQVRGVCELNPAGGTPCGEAHDEQRQQLARWLAACGISAMGELMGGKHLDDM